MKRSQRRRSMAKGSIALAIVLVMVFGMAVGGTLAWLTAQTDPVENTFTTSDINITLEESADLDLQIIPGHTIKKDPLVTVNAGSEASFLFIKVDEVNWPTPVDTVGETSARKVEYVIADGWTLLESASTNGSKVYYREVAETTADVEFHVLKDDQVTVSGTLTKTEMKAIGTGNNAPKLTVTAYACQKMQDNNTAFTAETAWNNVQP